MESTSSALRLRLILGKFRVVKIENNSAHIDLGNSIIMKVGLLPAMDIRPGDILTYYTEVPYHATAFPTSE